MEISARFSQRSDRLHLERRPAHEPADYEAFGVPPLVAAALEALRFTEPSTSRIRSIPAEDWPEFVAWAEARQIALTIAALSADALPLTERTSLARRNDAFRERMLKIRDTLREVSLALGAEQISFVVLKGFTHSPELTPNPLWRAQGDIDIWCSGANAAAAFQLLCKLGFTPMPSHSQRHLPPLARAENWKWDGNIAGIPIAIEIHEHLWEKGTEYAGAPEESLIWNRTVQRSFQGDEYRVLRTDDLISFAAFHFFLHLVNGDLPLQRAWEIANFLHSRADDESYWNHWYASHSSERRTIDVIVFRLVERWFGCRLPERVLEASGQLPEDSLYWLDEFAFEPLKGQVDANKNYLWLNCSVLRRWRDRFSAVRKCALPTSLPAFVDRLGDAPPDPLISRLFRQRHHLMRRGRRHLLALYPTLKGGLLWAGYRWGFEKSILPFIASCALFDIGEYLFVILFNFYLLELGLREDSIGMAAAGMSAGTLAGTPIATFVAHRFGLKNGLIIGALGCSVSTLARIAFTSGYSLVAFAFLNGLFFSFWAVSFIPAIAGLSKPKHRSVAYGLANSMGIAIGIVAGPVATRIPGLFAGSLGLGSLESKRAVLCMGSVLVALAALPAFGLRISPQQNENTGRSVTKGRFVLLFVSGVFFWMLATGAFNAFFTPYFSLQVGLTMLQIGTLFSVGQAVQVAATLTAPILVRRIGEARYVAFTVLATATMLLLLAGTPGRTIAPFVYIGYVAFQYANEPSLFAWLMNRVALNERTRASGLMFMTMSVAGMVAAAVSGRLIARSGYSPVLGIAALVAILAAVFFGWAARQNRAND